MVEVVGVGGAWVEGAGTEGAGAGTEATGAAGAAAVNVWGAGDCTAAGVGEAVAAGGGSLAAIWATTASWLSAAGGADGVWARPKAGQERARTASTAAARRSNFRCIAENLIALEQGRLVNYTILVPL